VAHRTQTHEQTHTIVLTIVIRDHGLFIENILDPSHLPFTHDGTLSKRSKADEMKVEMLFDNVFSKAAPAKDGQTDNTNSSFMSVRSTSPWLPHACAYE
jgi:phenylpropionate dioxygenase-like ring-hydroxylating dioxygenase large terminal subunit